MITFHEFNAFNEVTLEGRSGIAVRLAELLWTGKREHDRQARKGPYAPRQGVLAARLNCSLRSVNRAYAALRECGAIATKPRWRRWGDGMRQLSSAVLVLFDPEKGKERRAMAISNAEILRKMWENRNETIPLIRPTQSALMLEVRGLPKATAMSNKLVERGLHPERYDKPVLPKTRILYSENLLTSHVRKKWLWRKE